jgi:hypothetical protein
LNDKVSKLQKTSYSIEQQQSSKIKEDQEIQKKLTDQKEIMKMLTVSIINYLQVLVDRTISSPNSTTLSLSSFLTFSNQPNQNDDRYIKQELEEIHEMHDGDIVD